MAVQYKINQVCVWGTPGSIAQGKIVSFEEKDTAKAVEIEDDKGELGSLVFHDGRREMNCEVIAKASAVRPATGSTVSIAGTQYFVTESADKWTRAQAKKISISGFSVLDL